MNPYFAIRFYLLPAVVELMTWADTWWWWWLPKLNDEKTVNKVNNEAILFMMSYEMKKIEYQHIDCTSIWTLFDLSLVCSWPWFTFSTTTTTNKTTTHCPNKVLNQKRLVVFYKCSGGSPWQLPRGVDLLSSLLLL